MEVPIPIIVISQGLPIHCLDCHPLTLFFSQWLYWHVFHIGFLLLGFQLLWVCDVNYYYLAFVIFYWDRCGYFKKPLFFRMGITSYMCSIAIHIPFRNLNLNKELGHLLHWISRHIWKTKLSHSFVCVSITVFSNSI